MAEDRRAAAWRAELNDLLSRSSPSADELLRIAEVVDGLYDSDRSVSRIWWEKAAEAGSEDARDVLDLWDEERLW